MLHKIEDNTTTLSLPLLILHFIFTPHCLIISLICIFFQTFFISLDNQLNKVHNSFRSRDIDLVGADTYLKAKSSD